MSSPMRSLVQRLGPVLAAVVTLAGCMPGPGGSAGAAPDGSTGAAGDGAWRAEMLRDVRTDEAFTIDQLRGRLVAIEPMAIWCTNCRIQQHEVVKALAAIGSADLVYVGLDVDPNEEADALAAYAVDEGFDWVFAVASREIARSLAAEFGDQVLSPPSTPLILVGPDGTVLESHFGIRRAAELEALFRQHLP